MSRNAVNSARIDRPRPPGFALVVTLALMVLLMVVGMGMLSLSAISLRNSSASEAQSAARANARMALILAIGELQSLAGSDTRVSARADILDEDHPPLTGVWRSWEGEDHETGRRFAGRPRSPGNYRSEKKKRFLGWLVSGDSSDEGRLPTTRAGSGRVALVGSGATGGVSADASTQVHLEPVALGSSGNRGAIAWWAGGENQKARLPLPSRPAEDSAAAWSVVARSHGAADPSPFGLDSLLENPDAALRAVSRGSADLLAEGGGSSPSREFFHDLSTASVGLLTNTATGGWRKDLSLLVENWDEQPNSRLPLFRLEPGRDASYSKPTASNPAAASSMFYPWASYRGSSTDIPIYRHGPVTSWENLVDYATTYKRIAAMGGGRCRISNTSYAIDDKANSFNFLHRVRILPLIARIQWVLQHSAAITSARNMLEPRLLLTPVITMWNPYSIEVTATAMKFDLQRPLPVALRYTVNGVANPSFNAVLAGAVNNLPALSDVGRLNYEIDSRFILRPGETRVFSPASTTPVAAGQIIQMRQGYRPGGGHYFAVPGRNGLPMRLPASTRIGAEAKFDTAYVDGPMSNGEGVGIYLNMLINGRRHLVYRMTYKPEVANEIYEPLDEMAEASLSECQATAVPFLSTMFGARMASRTHLAAKGFVQSSPLVNYTAMGGKDQQERTIARHYGGTGHPVNSPFDYSFVKHAPGGDSLLPNASPDGRGYIVTGFSQADGLSRCTIADLPSRPLVSLGDLQHWDIRYENPIPPFAFNLAANSDATPLLPADAVVNSGDAGLAENLQYDDSFCINHLLFDDWFVSSIAPDPEDFGSSGRSQREVFTDFVSGDEPLSNRAYRPAGELASAGGSADAANELFAEHVDKHDAWRSIASQLEVEGMFNVNSTSVIAWRALLGHARNQRVAYIKEAGTSWQADLSEESDHPLSRFPVAGDTEAGRPGRSGDYPEATEFAGYRVVDEEFLDAMAEEVVRQVRARGPFLSLAEFVNRQLSSGELALAGTLQAALNELAKKSSTNLYRRIEPLSSNASATPDRAEEAEYQFPDAAVGKSAYGLPGWTRQADILRPLAPLLTARDDSFTIRAYGDHRDATGKVLARVVCEAVVRRRAAYVDPRDEAEGTGEPSFDLNKTFGRRFEVASFRWLAPDEV